MPVEDRARAELAGPPKPGDWLAGKYRIEHIIGQGGMSVVVAAEHTLLRQRVAVKLLLPAAAKRAGAVERFLREARSSAAIQSEHVARVLDVGSLETGAAYMVLELLSGQNLRDVVDERGPLPIVEAVGYLLQACEGIAEAHALGIIHRDLKPGNLFLTARADGSRLVKVLDFGLSKASGAELTDLSLTGTSTVMGSPYYMSPEQVRGLKGADARSDIWALGVSLYQILSGRLPFVAESLGSLFLVIDTHPAPPLRSDRPEIPAELEAIVMKCMAKAPAGRPQTVAELARLLAPFGSEDSRLIVERILRARPDHPPPLQSPSPVEVSARGAHHPRSEAPLALDAARASLASISGPVQGGETLIIDDPSNYSASPVSPESSGARQPAPLAARIAVQSWPLGANDVGGSAEAPPSLPASSLPAPSRRRTAAFIGGLLAVVALGALVAALSLLQQRSSAPIGAPGATQVPSAAPPDSPPR